jgi:hypothetical protein
VYRWPGPSCSVSSSSTIRTSLWCCPLASGMGIFFSSAIRKNSRTNARGTLLNVSSVHPSKSSYNPCSALFPRRSSWIISIIMCAKYVDICTSVGFLCTLIGASHSCRSTWFSHCAREMLLPTLISSYENRVLFSCRSASEAWPSEAWSDDIAGVDTVSIRTVSGFMGVRGRTLCPSLLHDSYLLPGSGYHRRQ